MLSKDLLSEDQDRAIRRLVEFDQTILIADTGAGKTVICLSAIVELQEFCMGPFIVAAPANVVPNWEIEAAKWEHTKHLRIATLSGDPTQRKKMLNADADIYVVSLNNLNWLIAQKHRCTGIIVDELSKAAGKQTSKLRTKAGASLTWRVGMTGTPVSQDFLSVAGQTRVVDGGKTFGNNMQKFRERYFTSDYMGYKFELRHGADEEIMEKLTPLLHYIQSDKAETLPPVNYIEITYPLSEADNAPYQQMRKHGIVDGVVAVNQAVRYGKLRQLASGFIYLDEDDKGERVKFYNISRVRRAKMWAKELNGDKGVIYYELKGQLDQLKMAFPDALFIEGGMGNKRQAVVQEFIQGDKQLLIAQVNSLSHGTDGLQTVCSDVLFYHPIWSRDTYTQARDRLWRTGQTKSVNCSVIICEGSLDRLVLDRVEDRAVWMKLFEQYLKE